MNERKSGIELMRIILFIMVIAIHIVSPYLTKFHSIGELNWLFANAAGGFSRIAVGGFVLISGYFHESALKKLDGKNFKGTAKRLLLPLAVYAPFYFILYMFVDLDGASVGNMIKAAKFILVNVPISDGYFYHLWFVQVFFFVTLLAPFFAVIVSRINKKQHLFLLLTLLSVCSFLPTIQHITGVFFYDSALLNSRLVLFIALYFAGAFVQKYPPRISFLTSLLIFIACEIIVVVMSAVYNYKISPYVFFKGLQGVNLQYPFGGFIGAFSEIDNTFIVFTAITGLVCFSKLNFYNGFINKTAKNIYGAYICHVFWIYVVAVAFSHKFNPYVDRWQRNGFYPLLVVVEIIIVAVLSILTEFLLSLVLPRLPVLLKKKERSK